MKNTTYTNSYQQVYIISSSTHSIWRLTEHQILSTVMELMSVK